MVRKPREFRDGVLIVLIAVLFSFINQYNSPSTILPWIMTVAVGLYGGYLMWRNA